MAASTKTMRDLFDGACCTLDLNNDLRRSYDDLMGTLDSWVYFCLWVKESKRELSSDPPLQPATQPLRRVSRDAPEPRLG